MYRVEVASSLGSPFKVKSGNYEFAIDIKGEGISPPDTLLASLASCMGVYIRKYCEGCGLTLPNFSITAEAEFCKDRPIGFKDINVSVDLKGTQLNERRQKVLLEFIKNCPVHNTLHMNPDVNIKIV